MNGMREYEKGCPPPMAVLTAHGDSWFGLGYVTDDVNLALVTRGFVLKRKRPYILVFSSDGTADAANHHDCAAVVKSLAECGVEFLRDHKQGWSPADTASDMRAKGFDVGPARDVSFNGKCWVSRLLGESLDDPQ